MDRRHFFFAGGGTAGHIYPAIAVAGRIARIDPSAEIRFFCGDGELDTATLEHAGLVYTTLPARRFSFRPARLARFSDSFIRCYHICHRMISASGRVVVVGAGGFVAAPACLAARRLGAPLALLSIDAVPGKANRLISMWAADIFVQFEHCRGCFSDKVKAPIHVAGCPLRDGFLNPDPAAALHRLNLAGDMKTLLIMGGSSGCESINEAACRLQKRLAAFSDRWQVVHLAGKRDFPRVSRACAGARINYKVLEYYHDMPDLLAAADIVVGRSGAVSVAEYAASGTASICLPYPHHRDRQQYLNAAELAAAGAAVIVEDADDPSVRTETLWSRLELLMRDDRKRTRMSAAARQTARLDAAEVIARKVIARATA